MKKFKKMKTNKAFEYFLDNPGAAVKSVANRFKISLPYAYRLRDQAATPTEMKPFERDRVTENVKDVGLDKLLGSRAKVYGKFADNARLAQALKRTMADHAQEMSRDFTDDQWEALEMIATKISRIVNGDPDSVDQWDDIAGYAKLIADRLRGVPR